MMVYPGHRAALVFRAEILPVPVDDHLVAVRVVRGHEEDDDIAENPVGVEGCIAGYQLMGEFQGHLGGGDLRGVEAAGDEEDGLALRRQFLCLIGRECPRIAKLLDDLPVAVELGHVFFRRDHGHYHGPFEGRLADREEPELRRFLVQLFEISLDLAVIGELLVGPDLVPEELLGRRLSRADQWKQRQKERSDRYLTDDRPSSHGSLLGEKDRPLSIICF